MAAVGSVGFIQVPGAEVPASLDVDTIIQEALKEHPFFLSSQDVASVCKLTQLTEHELLKKLVPMAKKHARPPISEYQVGIAALGKSGNIYLGVNLEFLRCPLNHAIHGEQFTAVNARNHGETELVAIALSAAPCGHCRQFLTEIGEAHKNIQILTPENFPEPLSSLLPRPFGPKDLGMEGGLLTPSREPLPQQKLSPLMAKAFEAAEKSYAPHTGATSGVAIRTKDNSIYRGSYLENAAYNPSISPLQAALVELVMAGKEYDEIEEVVLVQKSGAKVSQASVTREVLESIAPTATLQVVEQ